MHERFQEKGGSKIREQPRAYASSACSVTSDASEGVRGLGVPCRDLAVATSPLVLRDLMILPKENTHMFITISTQGKQTTDHASSVRRNLSRELCRRLDRRRFPRQ
jgi:hypothetical protein